jgi:hypothetical protein
MKEKTSSLVVSSKILSKLLEHFASLSGTVTDPTTHKETAMHENIHPTSISTTPQPVNRDWVGILCVCCCFMLLTMFAAAVFAALELYQAVAANTHSNRQLQIAVNQLCLTNEKAIAQQEGREPRTLP